MQNFSSIGKRIHTRKKIGYLFWPTLYVGRLIVYAGFYKIRFRFLGMPSRADASKKVLRIIINRKTIYSRSAVN